MKAIKGFDTAAYRQRLQLLREIVSGENQQEFAERLGIPFKRWNNYERGYPVPRETAFILMDKIKGLSVEWIWFGMTGNLSADFERKIKAAEAQRRELDAAKRAAEKANRKVQDIEKRKKVSS